PRVDVHHVDAVSGDDVDPGIPLAPEDVHCPDGDLDDLFLAIGVDGRLAPEVSEPPVVRYGELLPVDGEQERGVARVELADVAGHPAAHEAHAQRLPLDVCLGELPGARLLVRQPDTQGTASHHRLDDLPSLSG